MSRYAQFFLLGTALGCALGYYISKDIHAKKAQEEIDEVRARFAKRRVALKNEIDKERIELEKIKDLSKMYDNKEDRKSPPDINVREKETEQEFKSYERYFSSENENNEDEDSSEEEDEEDYVIDVSPKEGPKEILYSISPEEFAYEYPYFDKVTLIFYKGDNTLATEDEELVDDFNIDILSHMGEYEEGILYVRNEKAGCDYEVILEEGSYSDLYN